jgi:hypothetical protein
MKPKQADALVDVLERIATSLEGIEQCLFATVPGANTAHLPDGRNREGLKAAADECKRRLLLQVERLRSGAGITGSAAGE